tara:strand:- start:541 stop:714 length:174 start_codon:yes stop_codon:yes gene_type:complete
MINEVERKVDESKTSYHETAEEVFTLNIGCPHCKKSLSLSLAKLNLEFVNHKQGEQK